ncbi:alpha/beta hydrolase [Crocosphaera sp. XPORK-15E]|uniref:alpha/beta fold hydrolase n=1 Tax=Crocosphaera sp. XPORK-15E TaxID=3110247 RepID=UPI002B21F1B0|nr:alpha/beta hydrolase [Crocosphaera sp. XPORK-15E]MEA5534756.1 alpha/beta hydrolase [Crocosphaera sp. XPORK-15E]
MKHQTANIKFLSPRSSKSPSPLLIYLPGMDGTGKLFHRQAEKLGNFFAIRCLSIPSHDQSNWHDLADQTIGLIKQELESHHGSSVYLCGESFGGCLALKVALKAPELIEKMILVNPASSFEKRPWLGLGVQLNQWMPNFLYQSSTVGFLPFLGSLGRIEKEDSKALLKAMQSLPQEVVSWRLALLRDFQINRETLKRLKQPILMLASDQDRLLPSVAEGQQLMSYFPQGNLTILPNSGHACLLETEVNLAEVLRKNDFLPSPQIHSSCSSNAA